MLTFCLAMFNRSEFPSLASQSKSSMTKDQSSVNRHKSQASKLPLSTAPSANLVGKGKAEAANKQTGNIVGLCSYFLCYSVFSNITVLTLILQRQWTSGIGATASGPGSLEQMV